jgi:uncharacterized protein (TIGR03083 family)
MTMTEQARTKPRERTIDRESAMQLAATEYQRYADVLRTLSAEDWGRPTDCPAWDVRAMAAHNLGMAEMAASILEQRRQTSTAAKTGGVFIDALTDLQVRKHAGASSDEVVQRYVAVGPKAAKARRRTPGFIRKRSMPVPQRLNGVDEMWTVGYLVDVILTRDTWMHRVDTARATGKTLVLTPDHDGVLVADVVAEWGGRHDSAYSLQLEGPAGGTWQRGAGGPEYRLDAVEFCRILSGRATGDGLLSTEVPF